MELLQDRSSTLVFLELGSPSENSSFSGLINLGKIFIKLVPDTPAGRLIVERCTGENGRTFKGSYLKGVQNKGEVSEYLVVDDISNSDTNRLLESTRSQYCHYRKFNSPGAVFFSSWGSDPNYKLCIRTLFTNRNIRGQPVCGVVVDGLDLLNLLSEDESMISKTQIVDCGVVIHEY